MPVELAPSAREYGCDPKARSNPLRIPSPSAAQEPESRWKPRGIPMGCNTKCPGQTLGLPLECPSSSERPISRHTSSSPLRNSMTRTLDAVPKCHLGTWYSGRAWQARQRGDPKWIPPTFYLQSSEKPHKNGTFGNWRWRERIGRCPPEDNFGTTS